MDTLRSLKNKDCKDVVLQRSANLTCATESKLEKEAEEGCFASIRTENEEPLLL